MKKKHLLNKVDCIYRGGGGGREGYQKGGAFPWAFVAQATLPIVSKVLGRRYKKKLEEEENGKTT